MAMQQCANGHLYDDSKNSSCPYCEGTGGVNVTMPLSGDDSNNGNYMDTVPLNKDYGKTEPVQDGYEFNPPTPSVRRSSEAIPETKPLDNGYNATQYIDLNNKTENSGNPWDEPTRVVRGWLICVEGSRRGADFKIYGQKNTIGRGIENDIVLDFDSTVSRDVNAVVACDIRKNKFYLYQGNAKNNVYYNDDLLLTPVELKDYDIIEIGETKLMFKALCNDVFSWESLDAGKNDNK